MLLFILTFLAVVILTMYGLFRKHRSLPSVYLGRYGQISSHRHTPQYDGESKPYIRMNSESVFYLQEDDAYDKWYPINFKTESIFKRNNNEDK